MTGFRYQAFYCEENVWHLCQEPVLAGRRRLVTFISSESGACALFCQRAAPRPGRAVVWDYHVMLFAEGAAGWEAWDLDTTLGLPVPAGSYLEQTFRGATGLRGPRFRLIDPLDFIATFSSDRSHMRGPDGAFREPPPPWPAITRADEASNVMRLADVTDPFVGRLVDLDELRALVGGP